MARHLFTGFAPHATLPRVFIALQSFFRKPQAGLLSQVEEELQATYGVEALTLVDSGRSALLLAVKTLALQAGDEIIVPGYTCMVVANAIRATGVIPVYVDIDETLTMSPDALKRAITPRTKAIMMQYTFGEPGHVTELLACAKQHKLFVIEDAAHTVFGSVDGVLLGTFGDIGITSFGREKAISAERGGALFTNNPKFATQIRSYRQSLSSFSRSRAKVYLGSELWFLFGKKLYQFGIGKVILAFGAKIGAIPKIMEPKEKSGQIPHEPMRFPDVLVPLLRYALVHVHTLNAHRQTIARMYDEGLPKDIRRQTRSGVGSIPLEYSICVQQPEKLVALLRKKGVVLSRAWGGSPIVPKGSGLKEAGYTLGSCPNAEEWARGEVSLPTHLGITEEDAKRIIHGIHLYVSC